MPVCMVLVMQAVWTAMIVMLVLGAAASIGRASTHAPTDTGPAGLCEAAGLRAAHEFGVPAEILSTLALTETGRRLDGVVRPWAWSVNSEGKGTWFDSPREALDHARERLAQGQTNLDIGCFQINYRWHGEAFRSVAEMFDPLTNARYAADFLRRLHAETGDWRAAAGAFHSRNTREATAYLARFDELRLILRRQGTGGPETYNRFGPAGGGTGEGGEMPVPVMSDRGPIDVALLTGRVSGLPGDMSWYDDLARAGPEAGDLAGAPRRGRGQHRQFPPRTLLGADPGDEGTATVASLAPLARIARPLSGDTRPLFAGDAGPRQPLLVATTRGGPLFVQPAAGGIFGQ